MNKKHHVVSWCVMCHGTSCTLLALCIVSLDLEASLKFGLRWGTQKLGYHLGRNLGTMQYWNYWVLFRNRSGDEQGVGQEPVRSYSGVVEEYSGFIQELFRRWTRGCSEVIQELLRSRSGIVESFRSCWSIQDSFRNCWVTQELFRRWTQSYSEVIQKLLRSRSGVI